MSAGLLDKFEKMAIAMTPLQRIGGDEDLKGVVGLVGFPKPRATSQDSISPSTEA